MGDGGGGKHASTTRPPPARVQLISVRDVVFAKYGQGAAGGPTSGKEGAAGGAGVGRKRGRSEMGGAGSSGGGLATAGPSREDALATVRGTPIIIVPSVASSLITIHNAHHFLEGRPFQTPAEAAALATAAGEGSLRKRTITHVDSHGLRSRYHVVDDVSLLQRADWWVAEWRVEGAGCCVIAIARVQGQGGGRVCGGP